MNVLVTPEFTQRVEALPQDAHGLIRGVLEKLRAADDATVTSLGTELEPGDAANIFVMTAEPYRIFYTFARAPEETSVLLLDIIDLRNAELWVCRNPECERFEKMVRPISVEEERARSARAERPACPSCGNPLSARIQRTFRAISKIRSPK